MIRRVLSIGGFLSRNEKHLDKVPVHKCRCGTILLEGESRRSCPWCRIVRGEGLSHTGPRKVYGA